MKNITIPLGFRKLDIEERVEAGDFWLKTDGSGHKELIDSKGCSIGTKRREWDWSENWTIIRKIQPQTYTRKVDNVQVEIPYGWRILNDDEIFEEDDQYYCHELRRVKNNPHWIGKRVDWGLDHYRPYIRKIKQNSDNTNNMNQSESKEMKENMPEKIAIHCPTVEIFEAVQKIAFRHNWIWCDKSKEIVSGYYYNEYLEFGESLPKKYFGHVDKQWLKNKNYTILTLADIELIEKYLAQKPEDEIKVGDWVVSLSSQDTYFKEGDIGQISTIDSHFGIKNHNSDYNHTIVHAYKDKVRKATEEEIKKHTEIKIKDQPVSLNSNSIVWDTNLVTKETLIEIRNAMNLMVCNHNVSIDHDKKEIRVGCIKSGDLPFDLAQKIFERMGI